MAKTNTDQKNRKKARKSTGKDYKRTNLELAALKLLYHEPLFETVNKDQRDINVLVVGWNDVSKAFVDQCLSVGQMMGHYINIVVMTASPDPGGDMGGYLGERPALADFINIYILQKEKKTPLKNDDPCQDNAGEMYGDLYIMTYPEGADANTLLSSFPDKSREFNYIVLARKDDVNNKEIADSLVSELDNRKKKDCKVCYVVYDKDSVRRNGKAVPVYVPQNPFTDRIDRELVDKDLDRMAFNSHILWGSFVNRDYQEARRKFRPPQKDSDDSESVYFYSSSVAMAASIRYKLADIGIEWRKDFKLMAAEFEEKVTANAQPINELIALEHRRWLIDMATNGWSAPKKPMSAFCDECCKRKKVNDYNNKIHPCMVRCSSAPSVSSETEYGNNRQKWDEAGKGKEGCSDEEKSRFDELDQMSLSLHRAFYKKAIAYRDSNPLNEGPAACLETYCKDNKNERSWKRYLFCIKNVLNGNAAYSDQYDLYYDQFHDSLDDVKDPQVKKAIGWLEAIDSAIWPVLQSDRYIDYKNNDRKLIRGISFILTYTTEWHLALPVHVRGDMRGNFAGSFRPLCNVASATVIRPKKIVYIAYVKHEQIDDLKETVRNCEALFKDKNINSPVKVYVALSDSDPEKKLTNEKDSTEDGTGNVSYEFKECSGEKNAETISKRVCRIISEKKKQNSCMMRRHLLSRLMILPGSLIIGLLLTLIISTVLNLTPKISPLITVTRHLPALTI